MPNYAGDTTLYVCGKEKVPVIKLLENGVEIVITWFKKQSNER